MLELLAQAPTVKVGLMSDVARVTFTLEQEVQLTTQTATATLPAGTYAVTLEADGSLLLTGTADFAQRWPGAVTLAATEAGFTVHDVTIGVAFHWQRQEDQRFHGALLLQPTTSGKLTVINEIGVEDYLTSVIASEMSATAHPELLKAHAIISRSWLLAQLTQFQLAKPPAAPPVASTEPELTRWYDRENHADFDICADDHCQRYQGIAKATAPEVFSAIAATQGLVLTDGVNLCDARFSKSCGGFTELFSTAWQDMDLPYLQVFYDGAALPPEFALPLTEEANAAAWIRQTPPAFCCTQDQTILQRILPNFDQETTDFFRWQVTLTQAELQLLLREKLALDLGTIYALEPVERGLSGRLKRLRLVGSRGSLVIGKELEIRRALSLSHLYSSAFVVEPGPVGDAGPETFTLRGAGWGHGVGFCQIGAALMAEQGYGYPQILQHYYRGAQLFRLYR